MLLADAPNSPFAVLVLSLSSAPDGHTSGTSYAIGGCDGGAGEKAVNVRESTAAPPSESRSTVLVMRLTVNTGDVTDRMTCPAGDACITTRPSTSMLTVADDATVAATIMEAV